MSGNPNLKAEKFSEILNSIREIVKGLESLK